MQRPVIALQHIKHSAWDIEKLYSKTCVRQGLLNVIYTAITTVTQAQFLPVFKRNSRLKKVLWSMALPNEATLRGRSIISTTHRPKKNGVTETANSENIFKTGHLSNVGDPLTFHVIQKSKHGSSSFDFHSSQYTFLCLSLLCLHISSIRRRRRIAGVFLKFDPLRIWAVRLVDRQIRH